MAIHQDVENGGILPQDDMAQPLIQPPKISTAQRREPNTKNGQGSICVVLLSTFVAVCGSLEFGSCMGYSSPAQDGIIKDIGLSLAEYSVFGSILNIGAMFGAIASGRLADFLGRKGAMRISAVINIVSWLAVYFSMGAWSLDCGRFAMGFGTAVFSYVVPVFIAEIAPKNLRGGLTTVNQLMICSGISVTYILGTFLAWRPLALTGLIPCVILLLGLVFVPESPRWLAKMGYTKEFEVALRRLRGKDADITAEVAEIQEYIESLHKLPEASVQDLFQRRYAWPAFIGVGLMVFQQFGGINGVIFYASDLFVSAGFASGKIGTISIALFQVPITALGVVLLDKTGRRPLLLISSTGMSIGIFLTGTSFFLKSHGVLSAWAPAIALAGIVIFIGSFSAGMGAIPWVIMSEIFPINIKGVAGSVVTFTNWFGSWAVSYTFNFLMIWSSYGTFYIYTGICVISVLFISKLVPETKGRTLEEIQSSIYH